MTIFPSRQPPLGSGSETIEHRYCLLVAEPTIFGAQNSPCHELTRVMNKPAGVLLNKVEDGINPSELYAKEIEDSRPAMIICGVGEFQRRALVERSGVSDALSS